MTQQQAGPAGAPAPGESAVPTVGAGWRGAMFGVDPGARHVGVVAVVDGQVLEATTLTSAEPDRAPVDVDLARRVTEVLAQWSQRYATVAAGSAPAGGAAPGWRVAVERVVTPRRRDGRTVNSFVYQSLLGTALVAGTVAGWAAGRGWPVVWVPPQAADGRHRLAGGAGDAAAAYPAVLRGPRPPGWAATQARRGERVHEQAAWRATVLAAVTLAGGGGGGFVVSAPPPLPALPTGSGLASAAMPASPTGLGLPTRRPVLPSPDRAGRDAAGGDGPGGDSPGGDSPDAAGIATAAASERRWVAAAVRAVAAAGAPAAPGDGDDPAVTATIVRRVAPAFVAAGRPLPVVVRVVVHAWTERCTPVGASRAQWRVAVERALLTDGAR